jgi:phage-related holin
MEKTTSSLSKDLMEVGSAIVAFLKCSKAYLFLTAGAAWFFSTYDVKGILVLFIIATILDTITRIHADAINSKVRFNPFQLQFWMRIKSKGLKKMARKIFVEYGIAVIIAFSVDTLLFKNALHFQLLNLKLNIPIAAIIFFTGIEIWSIFENLEDAGMTNWLKQFLNLFSGFFPSKWKDFYDKLTKKDSNETRHN